MNKARLTFSFLNHWAKAYWPKRVHSPYLLDLMRNAYSQRISFDDIEQLRSKYLNDGRLVTGFDHGAGHGGHSSAKVSYLARRSLASPQRAAFLHGLVKASQYSTVLELGTSLGLTAAYLDRALPVQGRLITIEGNKGVADIAQETIRACESTHTTLLIGSFKELLPAILTEYSFDFVSIDGDHRYDAALEYFECLMSASPKPRMIYFDDIRWSDGMLKAWNKIVIDSRITLAADFFRFGIVFTSDDFANQYLRIRFLS